MSVEAITWALRQPIKHSSAKFVLVVLANCASADRAIAWPSVAYLTESTGQDRKTVMANLQRLQEWGLIEDTGRRFGSTKQIVVYKLICGPDLFAGDERAVKSPENGTVPKTEQSQKRNSSESGGEQSRFSAEESQKRDTEPSITQKNRHSLAQRDALRFSEFWEIYPNRVKRKPCLKRWQTEKLDRRADEIIAKLKQQIAEDRRWQDGFAPDPLTYLSQERWDDEIQPRREAAAPASPPAPSAPAPAPPRKPESKLENEIAYIRNQHRIGVYGDGPEGDEERDRLIAAARHRFAPAEEPEHA